jgi:hypothetical protein
MCEGGAWPTKWMPVRRAGYMSPKRASMHLREVLTDSTGLPPASPSRLHVERVIHMAVSFHTARLARLSRRTKERQASPRFFLFVFALRRSAGSLAFALDLPSLPERLAHAG